MCAAQLIPARGRQAPRASNRRRRLFPVNIGLLSLPECCTTSVHELCQSAVTRRTDSTLLILRDLDVAGNEKVCLTNQYGYRLNPLRANDIGIDYPCSNPFSNALPSYCKDTSPMCMTFRTSPGLIPPVKMTPVRRDFTLPVTRGHLNLFPRTVLLLLLAVLALLNHFRGIKNEEAPATISSFLVSR